MDRKGWALALLGIVVLGVAARVAYVLLVLEDVPPGLDAIWYALQGGSIRDGTGYVHPPTLFEPNQVATAGFPPAYPAYQALWQWLLDGGPTSVRLAGIVPGAATIALTGVLGRRVAGPAAGLLAAGLVALDPSLIAADGSTMSENLSVLLVVAVLGVASSLLVAETPRWPLVVGLGVLSGVAVLTRPDLLLLAGFVSLALLLRAGPVAHRFRSVAVLGLTVAVVLPWAFRNDEAVGELTVATLSPSSALAGSYCDDTYEGPALGSWSFGCVAAAIPAGSPTEVEVASAQRTAAREYAQDHLSRLPLVLAAREARVWSFWDPRDLARRDAEESRRYGWQLVARPIDAALAVVGTAGLVRLVRRRRDERWVLLLLAPLAVVVAGAALTHGNPRFAAIAHPVLVVGAASLLAGQRWLDQRKSRTRRLTTSGASRWRKWPVAGTSSARLPGPFR